MQVRVFDGGEREIKEEMERIGVDPSGAKIMLLKSSFYLLKVIQIGNWAANILKQEMLSLGAEAAISRRAYLSAKEKSDLLLIGRLADYKRLIKKLKEQPPTLKRVAEKIERTLKFFLKRPPSLKIMGILNVTPDSFYDGGRYFDREKAIEKGVSLVKDGADILDIGGESSRPGASPISVKEEKERVIPLIKGLAKLIKVPISIDTYKADVADRAIDAGAKMVNDISALRMDKDMVRVISSAKVPIVLMHMKGNPRIMQKKPFYKDTISEIYNFLEKRISFAEKRGVLPEKIIIDPGIGFGKRLEDNLIILKRLTEFKSLGKLILVGPSRKRFIGNILNLPVEERLEGTISAAIISANNGANILRVHDVKEVKRALKVWQAINGRE